MERVIRRLKRGLGFVRGLLLSRHATSKTRLAAIVLDDPFLPVRIVRHRTARFRIAGQLRILPFQGNREPVFIQLNEGSSLEIEGDFIIGPGVRVCLDNGATLTIGGRLTQSGSGITERTRIMVRRRVAIGKDFLCAWGVYITDCDWHVVDDRPFQQDVVIGDRVWIAPDASILKGARIGADCVVAAHSLVHKVDIPDHSLVAGNPARAVGEVGSWNRDLPVL